MGAFDSKPLNTTPLNNTLRRNPLLFGVPFVMIMVVASYALVPFAQTKYELQDRKISNVRRKPVFCHLNVDFTRNLQVSKEQELGLENRKRKFDIREEYFASLLPYTSARSLIYLPSASRNSARSLPKIGSPNASNARPEHQNGVYHHLNPPQSDPDPLQVRCYISVYFSE